MARDDSTNSRGRNGRDDPPNHDANDDKGAAKGADRGAGTIDDRGANVIDDRGVHKPDDKGAGKGAGKGADNPATHDIGDDHGGAHSLQLFVDRDTQQLVFTDDSAERMQWGLDDHMQALPLQLALPAPSADTVSVWRFEDPSSGVFFWTADAGLKDRLVAEHQDLRFDGEAFQAYHEQAGDDHGGGHLAVGLVWDHDAGGDYGNFIYAPVDDAIKLAGQSSSDGLEYLGVAFWI